MRLVSIFSCVALLTVGHLCAQSIPNFSVTPSGYQGGLYAYCVDSNGQFVPNCTPSIVNGYYQGTGGHAHDDPNHPFGSVSDNGQPNGGSATYQIAFSATRVAQLEYIDACSDTCVTTDVYVWFQGFGELSANGNQTLVGATGVHPSNHFGVQTTLDAISNITSTYAAAYGGAADYQVVGVNDIGLSGGGVFDLNANWDSPHIRHDYGKAVDFRANSNPNSVLPQAYNDFVQYCRNAGLSSLASWKLREPVISTFIAMVIRSERKNKNENS